MLVKFMASFLLLLVLKQEQMYIFYGLVFSSVGLHRLQARQRLDMKQGSCIRASLKQS